MSISGYPEIRSRASRTACGCESIPIRRIPQPRRRDSLASVSSMSPPPQPTSSTVKEDRPRTRTISSSARTTVDAPPSR
ncbi:MAG: hypothetical protein A3I06_03015 [Candidatus Lindowbacteria bacterium RIFCSPLOWO2_02_FULL_62_12]|nr:MAG: hypothetical protein A3I06_03015 [Candidatus Lindowbacteria bacterium RIFCSPLOWO2_02_FULL_62_12]